jgi:hypothetical protein
VRFEEAGERSHLGARSLQGVGTEQPLDEVLGIGADVVPHGGVEGDELLARLFRHVGDEREGQRSRTRISRVQLMRVGGEDVTREHRVRGIGERARTLLIRRPTSSSSALLAGSKG